MSQSLALVNIWVLIAAVPYLAIAGYDFWLHETDRQVPRVEQYYHAGIAIGVFLFLSTAALGYNLVAAISLAILLVAAAVDELRFHGDLDKHEKRLHHIGGLALFFCIGVWQWTIWS